MRGFLLSCFFIVFFSALFCPAQVRCQSFEISEGDTINFLDENNFKQGRWIIFNVNGKYPGFADGQKVIEEFYANGAKEGIRKIYFEDGKVKSEVTFKNNKPYGYSKLYHQNGNLSEEGTWENNGWHGVYKYYFENGQLSYEWNFINGVRDGIQKYYFENGQPNYIGEWKNGNETGILREFNMFGQLTAEKKYDNGRLDEASTKYYTPAPPEKFDFSAGTNKSPDQLDAFNGNGFFKLMNDKGLVTREGNFEKGKLINGKQFFYSSDGKMTKTVIYKNGKPVQEIPAN